MFRPLGVGITNLAYFLAKRGLNYGSDESLKVIDEYAEAWSFALLDASVDLAEERGSVADGVKYKKGIMPIDTYKKEVDELVKPDYKMDWDGLRRKNEKARNS